MKTILSDEMKEAINEHFLAILPSLLEVKCPYCEGTGKVSGMGLHDRWTEKCSYCYGNKVSPSDLGEHVIAFVKRHLSISSSIK